MSSPWPPPPHRSTGVGRWTGARLLLRLWPLTAGAFAIGTDLFVVPGMLTSLAAQLHVPVVVAGQTVTVYAAVAGVSAPVVTGISRGRDRRSVIRLALAGLVVGNGLAAAAPSYGWLLGTRALTAVAAAAYMPSATSSAPKIVEPKQGGRALAVVMAGNTTALLVGPAMGSLAASTISWRLGFLVMSAVAALGLLGALFRLPGVVVERPALAQQLALLRRAGPVAALASTALMFAGTSVLFTYLWPVVQEGTRIGPVATGFLVSLRGAAGLVGTALAGWVVDRWSSLRAVAAGLAGLVVPTGSFFVILTHAGAPGATVSVAAALAGWGLAAWTFYTAQYDRLMRLAPDQPSLAVAWNSPFTFLGVGLGSVLGGLTIQHGSLPFLGIVAATLELAALACVLASCLPARGRARSLDALEVPGPG